MFSRTSVTDLLVRIPPIKHVNVFFWDLFHNTQVTVSCVALTHSNHVVTKWFWPSLVLMAAGLKEAVASKWVKTSYFFYWRKIILRVWLITCQKILRLRAREPLPNGGYACIIGVHLFILSKLWGHFSQLQNRCSKKNITQSFFSCYKDDFHIKALLKGLGFLIFSTVWL